MIHCCSKGTRGVFNERDAWELGSREMELLSEDNGDNCLPALLHEFTEVGQTTK